MKGTMPLQKIITLRGKIVTAGKGHVSQPAPGWVDTQGAKDAAITVTILRKDGTTARDPKLIIETSQSVTGPWKEIMSYHTSDPAPLTSEFGVSTGYGPPADKLLQRYLRWRIDVSALTTVGDTWALCFRACVTLK